jgi:hypothetical protein
MGDTTPFTALLRWYGLINVTIAITTAIWTNFGMDAINSKFLKGAIAKLCTVSQSEHDA